MKKLALSLLAALITSLLCPSARADSPPAASGPRPGTVEAMQCLVRQGPSHCGDVFQGGARTASMPWVFVSAEGAFARGPLVSSRFWGRASEENMFDAKAMMGLPAKEMDIYDIKFAHTKYTFYISPAGDDGKIRALKILLYPPHDPFQISNCSGGRLCASGSP